MSSTFQILLVVLSFVMSLVITGFLIQLPNFLPDVPNQRSLHQRVTPRGGGLSFCLTFLLFLGLILWLYPESRTGTLWALLVGGGLIGALGLLDDAFELPALTRRSVEFAVSLAVCAFFGPDRMSVIGIFEISGWPVLFVQVIWLLACINFFNFMDGMDGLATTQAWFIALAFGAALWLDLAAQLGPGHSIGDAFAALHDGPFAGAVAALAGLAGSGPRSDTLTGWQSPAVYQTLAALLFALAAGLLGFLVWNLPPARIYKGDAGYHFLGITLGFLAIAFPWDSTALPTGIAIAWTLDQPPARFADMQLMTLLWMPFLLDPLLTLIYRLRRGENPLRAHREHCYQLLYQRGWSAARVVLLYAMVNVSMLIPAALKWLGQTNQVVLACAGALILVYSYGHARIARSAGLI